MTLSRSPNRDRLIRTAREIRPLLNEFLFVGGQVAELLVTDPGAVRVRPTEDVDVVVRAATRTEYQMVMDRLQVLGFEPDRREGAPICRVCTLTGLVLDVMPLDETVLGFSNRWYAAAIEHATEWRLESDLTIRMVNAPVFLATKWEAFATRGVNDPMLSHDLEDIVTVVAGRPKIVGEVQATPKSVREFVGKHTQAFLAEPWSTDVIEGSLPDARQLRGLVQRVTGRLNEIASCRD